jgi:hypothetical protein
MKNWIGFEGVGKKIDLIIDGVKKNESFYSI